MLSGSELYSRWVPLSTLVAYILPSLFESDLTEIKTLNNFLSSLISITICLRHQMR